MAKHRLGASADTTITAAYFFSAWRRRAARYWQPPPGPGSHQAEADRWLDLGFLRFQPLEPMKIALILALARYCATSQGGALALLPPLAMIALPTAMALEQPDLSGAVLLAAGGLAVLGLAGLGSLWLAALRRLAPFEPKENLLRQAVDQVERAQQLAPAGIGADAAAAECPPGPLTGEVTYIRDGDTIELATAVGGMPRPNSRLPHRAPRSARRIRCRDIAGRALLDMERGSPHPAAGRVGNASRGFRGWSPGPVGRGGCAERVCAVQP